MGKFLYETIKDYLKKLIQENKNVPNYKLPSENQLAMRFSTTRMTAKRAISELQEEGLLYRIHGKGSFITAAPAQGTDVPVNEFICMLLPNLESHFILELCIILIYFCFSHLLAWIKLWLCSELVYKLDYLIYKL